MSTPRVIFRVDGNAQIGLGHVIRCLALADMLAPRFRCEFTMRNPSAELHRQVLAAGHLLADVPAEVEPGGEEAQWLRHQAAAPAALVVLDGYQFTAAYQRIVSYGHFGLACLDDLITAPVWANLVLNQAGGVTAEAYAAAPGATLCLGPAYALLRPAFQARAGQQTDARPWTGRVFLNMGGADPGNATENILGQLLALFPGREIAVVTGAAYPHQATLTAFAAAFPMVQLHHNLSAPQLSRLLLSCDIMVCPPSGMAYECCAVGGLLLLHQTADNQQAMFDFLWDNGLAMPLPEIGAHDNDDAHLQALATELRAHQQQLFDGQAAQRLRTAFEDLHLTARLSIRRALPTDCARYFAWANDADVRQNAIQSEPIAWPTHEAWFARRLADPASYLYIAAHDGLPVGQVRVEFDGSMGTIDYSVAAEWRGTGLGRRLLQQAIHELRHERPGSWTLRAEVKATNYASSRVFERLHFSRQTPLLRHSQRYEVFELAVNSGL
jgi:UDP-2,4-diacetamido-2,4,6-trideoxy-beta-L-altropyranose hydrolase